VREGDNLILVLELCSGGDLETYLQQQPSGRISEKETCKWVRQLAQGLQFLRSKHLIHRDLKPGNLLLSSDDTKQATLKITDFTFARFIEVGDLATTLVGTPLYMAPEIFVEKKYTEKVDLWSVGVILFHCLSGRLPFNGKNIYELFLQANVGKVMWSEEEKYVSTKMKVLVEELLQRDARIRMSWDEFFNHPLVSDAKRKMKKMRKEKVKVLENENAELKMRCEKCEVEAKMKDEEWRLEKEKRELAEKLKEELELKLCVLVESEKTRRELVESQVKNMMEEKERCKMEAEERVRKVEKKMIELIEQEQLKCMWVELEVKKMRDEREKSKREEEEKIKTLEAQVEMWMEKERERRELVEVKDRKLGEEEEKARDLELHIEMLLEKQISLEKGNEELTTQLNLAHQEKNKKYLELSSKKQLLDHKMKRAKSVLQHIKSKSDISGTGSSSSGTGSGGTDIFSSSPSPSESASFSSSCSPSCSLTSTSIDDINDDSNNTNDALLGSK